MTMKPEEYEGEMIDPRCPECGSLGSHLCAAHEAQPDPALKARYEEMGKSEWFKEAHEGRSLGEPDPEPRRPCACGRDDFNPLLHSGCYKCRQEAGDPEPEQPSDRLGEIAREIAAFDGWSRCPPNNRPCGECRPCRTRAALEALVRENARSIRIDCEACDELGRTEPDGDECEYCGRPMRKLLARYGLKEKHDD